MTTNKIHNDGSFAIKGLSRQPRKFLTVEFVTDPVPGAWYDPEDLMRWINSNSYVVSVEEVK